MPHLQRMFVLQATHTLPNSTPIKCFVEGLMIFEKHPLYSSFAFIIVLQACNIRHILCYSMLHES